MATNTCSELIIHPACKPYHLNVNHSNISFGIALRNQAKKECFILEHSVFDNNPSLSEEQIHRVRPISVALPSVSSEATPNTQPTGPDFMMTSVSDVEEEHVVQDNLSLNSCSRFVLESVHDPPFEPNRYVTIESSSTNNPGSSTQIIPQPHTINVSPPPTFLLDYVILKVVCENIIVDLDKQVESRNNFVHAENYVEKWTALRERVDEVMCELHRLSIEAHPQSITTLNNWFQEVVNNTKEEVNRELARRKLSISDSPFYLDASIISASVHEDVSLNWLTKLKVQADTSTLAKLQCDSEQQHVVYMEDLLEFDVLS